MVRKWEHLILSEISNLPLTLIQFQPFVICQWKLVHAEVASHGGIMTQTWENVCGSIMEVVVATTTDSRLKMTAMICVFIAVDLVSGRSIWAGFQSWERGGTCYEIFAGFRCLLKYNYSDSFHHARGTNDTISQKAQSQKESQKEGREHQWWWLT